MNIRIINSVSTLLSVVLVEGRVVASLALDAPKFRMPASAPP